uniref:50S ribosomal protein L34 n=1 Tax=Gastroclonium compressum TaxID=1852973 RepID=A0A173FZU8_GASCM|nr:50S ribosomal protein L34 [Coeloseira compressa]ANH09550.1 50S ribosomal protein L34 [Coeloseira compressa]
MSKQTLQGTKLKKIRKSGFRSRMKTSAGRRVIKSRRSKKRLKVAI